MKGMTGMQGRSEITLSDIFRTHGFIQLWHPFILFALCIIAYFYIMGNRRKSIRLSFDETVSTIRQISFFSGLVLIYIAEGSPLKVMGDYLFTIHMLAMSLAFITAPPLLLSGLPLYWLRILLRDPIYPVIKFLTKPILAIFVFNIFISFFHFPFIFDFVMAHPWAMDAYDTLLLITGLLMWWPVASPLTEFNVISHLKKIAYIFGAGVLLTPACALIMFTKEPLYSMYLNVPRLWHFDLIDDQNTGGITMKIVQELTYIGIMGFIFLQWTKEAREQNQNEKIEYRGTSQDWVERTES